MLKLLLFNSLKSLRVKTGRKGKLPKWAVYVIIFALFTVSFTPISMEFAFALIQIEQPQLYFALCGATLFGSILISNIIMAQNQIYESTYNDALLALPIKPETIVTSRLANMLVYDYFYELMISVIFMAGWYAVTGQFDFCWARMIVVIVFWPGIGILLSSVIGYFLHRVSGKFRNRNLIRLLLLFGFMAVYYYFSFNMQKYMTQLVEHGAEIAEFMAGISLTNWFGKGIYDGDAVSIAMIILVNVAAAALTVVVLGKTFFKAVTGSVAVARVEYKEKPVRETSVLHALLKREYKRLVNTFMYLTNTVMALFMMLVSVVFALIKWKDIHYMMNDVFGSYGEIAITVIFLSIAMFSAGTYLVSSSSISLDGKSLDALKALPVDSETTIISKVLFHYLSGCPVFLLSSVVCLVLLKPSVMLAMAILLLPQAYLLLTGELGLCYNLKWPKLDWTNEAQVVKRGGASVAAMFTNYAIIGLYFLISMLIDNLVVDMYLLVCTLVTLILAAVVFYLLVRNGSKAYEKIGG